MTDLDPTEIEGSSLVPEPAGPFTLAEYRRAFQLLLPEEEALAVAAAVAATENESRPGERTTFGEELLDDCLILLSFLSGDLWARVERFRAERREHMARLGYEAERLDSRDRRFERRRASLEAQLRERGTFPGR
ncbi:MAG TPA: hypothetical protein VD793_05805 [Gemmatimonadales bacterium]|nr:hypothetical protein [Gemmatimonadales bacterium]